MQSFITQAQFKTGSVLLAMDGKGNQCKCSHHVPLPVLEMSIPQPMAHTLDLAFPGFKIYNVIVIIIIILCMVYFECESHVFLCLVTSFLFGWSNWLHKTMELLILSNCLLFNPHFFAVKNDTWKQSSVSVHSTKQSACDALPAIPCSLNLQRPCSPEFGILWKSEQWISLPLGVGPAIVAA